VVTFISNPSANLWMESCQTLLESSTEILLMHM
jgi:hypothetical protein